MSADNEKRGTVSTVSKRFGLGSNQYDLENPIYQMEHACPDARQIYNYCIDNFYALNVNVRLTTPGHYQKTCKAEYVGLRACLIDHMDRWTADRQGDSQWYVGDNRAKELLTVEQARAVVEEKQRLNEKKLV